MAKYDQGGGCACGLKKECDCPSNSQADGTRVKKPRKFPCPYCKGEGTWVEPVLDYGQGPEYSCGFCEGEGMIEVDGPKHRIIKDGKIWMKKLKETPGVLLIDELMKLVDGSNWPDLQDEEYRGYCTAMDQVDELIHIFQTPIYKAAKKRKKNARSK